MKYVEQLLDLAKTFTASTGDNTGVDRLVLQYMRALNYNDAKFWVIIGKANSDFVAYVDHSHTRRVAGYVDPKACTAVHADHWAVSTEGFLQYPTKGIGKVNWADFLGWGGDLISFYGKWRSDGKGAAGWCPSHLFTPGTTFNLRDIIEDADAFNMGTVLHAGKSDIAALVRQNLLAGGYKDRFQRFGDGRFKTRQGGTDTVHAMLTDVPSDAKLIRLYRIGLLRKAFGGHWPMKQTPGLINEDELATFVECFVAKLISIQP